jgi:hypothetical protein
MDFQAEVGTWLAAHILARLPVGGRFGMANTFLPVSIRLETGEGLDDTLLTQEDGARIDLQSKTQASLSESASSPLGKTIAQLARSVVAAKEAGAPLDPFKARAVLAVSASAPRTLENLEKGCRAYDTGGNWTATKAQRNENERDALDLFEKHARTGWAKSSTTPPDDDDLVAMARLFRIVRFSMDEGDDNWREASRALGGRLYGSEGAGDAPLRDLKAIVRGLIGSGAPADRSGLVRALRSLGHEDVGAPNYEADLTRLKEATGSDLVRLGIHTRLPIAGGVPITRESDGPLTAAIGSGSLIVIGEPGAGKTGALVALAAARRAAGDTVVFLSVDRFPGVAIAADLQFELRLVHPLIDVLAAAPGSGRKLLCVDALDAARGGPAEGVFAQLIEEVGATLGGDWTIVASIRTFDLKNGRRYREAIPGSPPDPAFADAALHKVRHFQVPRLTGVDLASAGAASPELETLLTAAPEKLRDLLRNVFNLSLAAQLLTDGATPDSIRTVATQSDLIDAYEDRRLVGTPLQKAAAATVNAMVQRRRLAVRKVVIAHDRIDEIIQSGVLADVGDLVSFSHHVLFDHVAGRFFLEWDEPSSLIGQLGGDSSIALMLAPGLRFAVERFWRTDNPGMPSAWRLIADVYADANVDPVLANVALRTAIERVSTNEDVGGLARLVADRANEDSIATMLSRLARFVGLAVDTAGSITAGEAIAWATIAEAAAITGVRSLADAVRFLLHTIFDKGDLADPALLAVFGRAARALLALAWAADPPMQQTATNAIRFVGKSFASDPEASRNLLDRALRDPHFSAHADKEAAWLAEQIMPIAWADADFAVEIFRVFYSRDITDDSTSFFGGQPSRIMPLSSSRRQDYHSCRYNLGRKAGRLLEFSAKAGTRAVIEAALGDVDRAPPNDDEAERVCIEGWPPFDLLGHERGFNAWDEPDEDRGVQDDDVLGHYVTFLRTCSVKVFTESIEAAAAGYSSAAVWARLLGVGAERVADVADLLWPFASATTLLAHEDTMRDAVKFLAAAYPTRSIEQRRTFEAEALRTDLFTDEHEQRWWQRILSRLFSLVEQATLVTDAMRTLRSDLIVANEVNGNPPLRSMTTSRRSVRGITRGLLARDGVNVDEGVDARMLAQSETLYELVQETPADSDAAKLAVLWAATEATVVLFDTHAGELDECVEQPVWGHVSNAVERIAGSKAYVPGSGGLPDISVLLALLRRLWASRFPEPKKGEDSGLSWSNWAVRVYAADAYVSLAACFGAEHPEIVAMFDAILADPVPQVRLQAAQNLQVLSRIAPKRMWALADLIAGDESHEGVLGSFLNHVVPRFTWHDVELCEALIEAVTARRLADEREAKAGRDHIAMALGGLTAQLWVWQDRAKALAWLSAWAGDPVGHRELLTSFLSTLRAAFFARYASGEARDPALGDRAQRAAMVILEACSVAAVESYAVATADGAEGETRDAAVARYRAAEQVVGHLMNQFYFGSGAYAGNKEAEIGLKSVDAMRQFLADYQPALELLAGSHEPATHHHLVELYEYLIPGDPSQVFDAVHGLLLGAGAREGYHYESLASTVIVRMITRYIADHRSIFEDDVRRAHLVEMLRLFSDVGWSDALKLLYDLPELLR